ncbi:MAG: N-(5'-phosphoribosyl)anthranilate isomerase [Deltaproteobacteria bacterium]|nr:N-(5'-phosphoribosyl)anthranilate isomerase [Deltaproteobacteria bacterium]
MTGSVRIKVCGVTTPEDAVAAVEAGADLVGVNFVSGSPREVDPKRALEICEALEGYEVERVALFRDAQWEKIDGILRRVPFERVQFHGDETEDEVEAVDLPTIKAIRGADQEAAEIYPGSILLLDHPHQGGGQGQAWDWSEAEDLIAHGHDVIIAGGLTPGNVAEALADAGEIPPWGVDVATGVEAEGYHKDPEKMRAFVAAVREREETVEAERESGEGA